MHTNRVLEFNPFQPRRSVLFSSANEQKGSKFTRIENPEEFENPENPERCSLQSSLNPPSKKKKRRLPGETLLKKYALQIQQKKKIKMSTDSIVPESTQPILPESTMTGGGDDNDEEVEEKTKTAQPEPSITTLDSLHVLLEHLMKSILRGGTKDNPRKVVVEARQVLMNSFLPVLQLSQRFKSLSTEDEVKTFVSAASEQIANAMDELLGISDMKEETVVKLQKGLSRALSKNSRQDRSKATKAIKQVANKTGRSIQKSFGGPPVSRITRR